MSRVLNIVYSLLEAGPDDDFDPKGSLMNTEPSGVHWLLAQGFRQEGDSYRKTYKNGWAVVRITAADATPFEVVLNFRDGGRQSYFSLTFEELRNHLRRYLVISESDPDEVDPKAEMMRVDPTSDIRRIIGRFKRQDLDVHSWSRLGDILKIKALPLDTGMHEEEVEMGVYAELQRMGIPVDPMAVTVSKSDGWFIIMFPLPGMPARSHKRLRGVVEAGPDDDLDPKDYIRKLPEREPRMAYGLLPSVMLDPSETTVSPIIVKEGEPGYHQTDWNWNKVHAQAALDAMNAKLGLTPTEAEQVLMSSMFPKKGKRRVRESDPDDVNPREMLSQLPEPILVELSVDISNGDDTVVADTRKVTVDANEFLKARSPDKLAMYYRMSSGDKHQTFGLTFMGNSQAAVQIFRQFPNTEPLIDYLVNREGTARMTYDSKALRRWIEKNRPEVLTEAGPDDVDPRAYLRALPERDPRIKVSFARTTPESAAEVDFSETGWEDEEGKSMLPDSFDHENGLTVVDIAVSFLQDGSASYPSASHFHPGVWYTTEMATIDYGTGEQEEKAYHLHGFDPDEELEIWKRMCPNRPIR